MVHRRRPIGNDGVEKQRNQCRALLRWAMRHLSGDPKANLVTMGDFNEGGIVTPPTGKVYQFAAASLLASEHPSRQ